MSAIGCEYQLEGRLQGVGFRPFVFRLARELDLRGWVKNTSRGVSIAVQGESQKVSEFENRFQRELPPHARIRNWTRREHPLSQEQGFKIVVSSVEQNAVPEISPDLAMCPACEKEIFDPANRRYRYAFTGCVDCGPRYSVVESLPYDRSNTTMNRFVMCGACQQEYDDPNDRRFHAQANGCQDCGPTAALKNSRGEGICRGDSVISAATQALRDGAVVAVQGIGGFHLLCDAARDTAIAKLRAFKRRKSKPFALMVANLNEAKKLCLISAREELALTGKGAPIVLLSRRREMTSALSPEVAPGLTELGVMLAYTPLHRLLLEEWGGAVVATSGNVSEEPLCIAEDDAIARLGEVADFFLVHDRAIAWRVDDSVVRVIADTEVVVRGGRGYAPFVLDFAVEVTLPASERFSARPIAALGAHQKNTLCWVKGGTMILSPHIGDLDSASACEAYRDYFRKSLQLLQLENPDLARDWHPDYASSRLARTFSGRAFAVQHHEAHVFSCIAEHKIQGEVLGVAWDGTGLGEEAALWGGEFFTVKQQKIQRVATLRRFRLPGASKAIREPRRSALGLHFAADEHVVSSESLGFTAPEARTLFQMLARGVNSPWTSSVGRLFDGVASLLGLRHIADYEAHAALELEALAAQAWDSRFSVSPYAIEFQEDGMIEIDWAPMIRQIKLGASRGELRERIALRFHLSLAEVIVRVAEKMKIPQVALSGGCFQNRILSELAIDRLKKAGFRVFWNQRVPPNDGGISVGQAYATLIKPACDQERA